MTENREIIAVILAGGRGARMYSKTNKVLAEICGKPIINYLIDEVKKLGVKETRVVLGHNAEMVRAVLPEGVKSVVQPKQLGTGDALKTAVCTLRDFDGEILLINGDGPIVSVSTLNKICALNDAKMMIFTANLSKLSSFGRIIRKNGAVVRIAEAKDCTPEEIKITEQNLGIYCFDNQVLQQYIYDLNRKNAQNEYYVTDLVAKFAENHHKIAVYNKKKGDFYLPSVNTLAELSRGQAKMQYLIIRHWQSKGVNIVNPWTSTIDIYTKIGKFSEILPNSVLKNSILGESVQIGGHCWIENCEIAENVQIGAGNIIFNQKITQNVPHNTLFD